VVLPSNSPSKLFVLMTDWSTANDLIIILFFSSSSILSSSVSFSLHIRASPTGYLNPLYILYFLYLGNEDQKTHQQAIYLTNYFYWTNKIPLPLATSIGPTNGELKICSVVSPTRACPTLSHACARRFPPPPPRTGPPPCPSTSSRKMAGDALWPHRLRPVLLTGAALSPTRPALSSAESGGPPPHSPHEEEGHAGCSPGTVKPPSVPLLPPVPTTPPPALRSDAHSFPPEQGANAPKVTPSAILLLFRWTSSCNPVRLWLGI
jgi:hypothetical protein